MIAMFPPTILNDVRLIPVIELEPWKFSHPQRQSPNGTGTQVPEEWHRYWVDSLSDAGITGLQAVRPGSWHVGTRELSDPAWLAKIVTAIVQNWGGPEALTGVDSDPVFCGGLALCEGDAVLAEPTCCGDLRNWAEWREAASYRDLDWKMLWIGHPWLSVRFADGRLVLSEPHESASPVGRWMVEPMAVERALALALVELRAFAERLRPVVGGFVGEDSAATIALSLAGLAT